MNQNRKRRDGNVPESQMPNASLGANSAISRGQFLKTVGVGAAAVGVAAMGFSGVGRAQEVAPLSTTTVPPCRIFVGGFQTAVPDGLTPIGVVPGTAYPVFVKHPNYDDAVKENCMIFNSCEELPPSPQIPIGHGLTWGPYGWGMNETADYTVGLTNPADIKFLTFFGSPFTPSPPGAFPALDNGVMFNQWYIIPPSPTQNPLPPSPGTGGLTWGQAFAYNGAALNFFVNTYNTTFGPYGPKTDVTEVPKPGDLNDPSLNILKDITTRVEFTVTVPFSVYVATTPTGPYPVLMPQPYTFKIFGWFMHKKGKAKGNPLVVHMNGIFQSMEAPVMRNHLTYVSALAHAGYDVLYFDKPGHGWSQGKLGTFYPSAYFQIIDQLHTGVKAIGPNETTATTKKLINGEAKQTKLVLSGGSLGAMFNSIMNAGNMHPEWYTIPNPTPGSPPLFTMPFTSADNYNIVGIIDMEGLPGGLKYTSPGLLRVLSGFLAYGMDPNNAFGKYVISKLITGSSELTSTLSDPEMPPLMTVTSTQNYMSPAGAVYAYNTHTGQKKIFMVEGLHGSLLNPTNTNVYDIIPEVKEFIKDCTKHEHRHGRKHDDEEHEQGSRQITLEQLVCETMARINLGIPEPYDEEKDHHGKEFRKQMKEAVKHLKRDDDQ